MSAGYHHQQPGSSTHVVRWLLVVVVVAVGIAFLREATMNRPDPPRDEQRSTVVLEVETNASRLTPEAAATGLWAACASAVDRHALVDLATLDAKSFALKIEPALGHHAEARLVGCLEDVTVPRILGNVTGVEHR